jgi:PAS domain S-box-containing protein
VVHYMNVPHSSNGPAPRSIVRRTDARLAESRFWSSSDRSSETLIELSRAAMLMISAEGRIAYASRAAYTLLRCPARELVGRDMLGLIHAEDQRRVRQVLAALVADSGSTALCSFRCRRPDGAWTWFDGVATNRLDDSAMHAIVAHLWEARRQEPRPSSDLMNDRVRLLLEHAAHITAVIGPDGVIRYVSPVVQRMLGYPPEDLHGLHVSALLHPGDAAVVNEALNYRARQAGRGSLFEFRVRHKDGSWRVMEAIATNRLDDPQVAGVVIDARDVTERKWSAERLQRSLDALLAIHDVGRLLGSSLEKQAIAVALLEGAQRLAAFDAAALRLQTAQGRLRLARTLGRREVWESPRNSHLARTARAAVMMSGVAQTVRMPHAARRSAAACVLPLRVHERVIGVLELYGSGPADGWPTDLLGILADQTASALERGRLYQALAERERRLEQLIRRLLLTQEEERRRVSYEVHDGIAQLAAAAQQHLEAFASRYRSRNSARVDELRQALDLASRTVREARRVIGGLRPRMLDDYGLARAIAFELQGLRTDGWQVEYTDKFGPIRLDPVVETALFRVLQEALANVRNHAHTNRVAITLERHDRSVRLEIRDWGCGFRPAAVRTGAGPSERLGLAGMQERMALLHGRCTIRSRLGAGARIEVEVPLREARNKK